MKKFTFQFLAGILCFLAIQTQAQNRGSKPDGFAELRTGVTPIKRCYTVEAQEEYFRTHPGSRAQFDQNQHAIQRQVNDYLASRVTAINDTITVVIHVIGSAAIQTLVTDQVLRGQVDTLTADYQGKNADSTRIPAHFKPIFGKMGITFLLAKTDPNGLPTTGIERRENAVTFTAGTADNAKQNAQGGMNAWDPAKYLNLWVVSFGTSGILGISVFPGDPRNINLHGFVCDYRAFGSGAPYL
ncbi:MAG: hypothetical protein EOP54_29960, partial [Sphingobacteriales bacterium]